LGSKRKNQTGTILRCYKWIWITCVQNAFIDNMNVPKNHVTKDTYSNFLELRQREAIDVDYRISICDRGSTVTILAPHGGKIEPMTSYIARKIAKNKFNFYCFEGIKPLNNRSLHLTSHNFDEPQAIRLLARSPTVVTIHACRDKEALVYPGGRDKDLIDNIVIQLNAAGIPVAERNAKYPGTNPHNVCIRGASGRGTQLEISRGLRDDIGKLRKLCAAVHLAISELKDERTIMPEKGPANLGA
jgi:phage replication-related protein YjqB (UPF0714/DUF867 family)